MRRRLSKVNTLWPFLNWDPWNIRLLLVWRARSQYWRFSQETCNEWGNYAQVRTSLVGRACGWCGPPNWQYRWLVAGARQYLLCEKLASVREFQPGKAHISLQLVWRENQFLKCVVPYFTAFDIVFFGEQTCVWMVDLALPGGRGWRLETTGFWWELGRDVGRQKGFMRLRQW